MFKMTISRIGPDENSWESRKHGQKQKRKTPLSIRLEQIGEQLRAVVHGDSDILGPLDVEFHFAERAVFAASRLQTISVRAARVTHPRLSIHLGTHEAV
jgi:hypothetical protein